MKWLETWVAFRDGYVFETALIVWFAHTMLVVLVAWLIAEIFARAFAAVRYGIWIITCFSLLTLAVVSFTATPLLVSLRLLPADAAVVIHDGMSMVRADQQKAAQVTPVDHDLPIVNEDSRTRDLLSERGPVGVAASHNAASDNGASAARPSAFSKMVFWFQQRTGFQSLVGFVYVLGVFVVMMRTLMGYAQLSRLINRSSPISASRMKLARRYAREIGLFECPRCVQSDEINMPMAIGVVRPSIVLPVDLQECDISLLRHCMLHEMAHVRHRDGIWNLLGEITKAIYWFHPGVYFARKMLIQAREYLADDLTLKCCGSRAAYSRSLLALNRVSSGEPNSLAGIGATAHLERRIRRILHPQFQPRSLSKWVVLLPAIVLGAMSTCAFRLDRVIAQAPAAVEDVKQIPDATTTTAPSLIETRASQDLTLYEKFNRVTLDQIDSGDQFSATFVGQVTDKSGPVSDAIVLLRLSSSRNDSGKRLPIVAKTRTDKDGRYRAQFIHSELSASSTLNRIEILVADKQSRLAIDVRQLTNVAPSDTSSQVDLSLDSSQALTATFESEAAQPLSGVRVSVLKAVIHSNVRNAKDPFAGKDPFGRASASSRVPHQLWFFDDRIRPSTSTQHDGRFLFSGADSLLLAVEKDGLFHRTPELYADAPLLRPGHRDSHQSPALIGLADEINISAEVNDPTGNQIQDFTIGIRNLDWRLRKTNDGTISTAESYLSQAANSQGQVFVVVRFPKTSGWLPILRWVDVQTLVSSRKLKLETEQGVWLSGRVVKSDTGSGLKSVWVSWKDPASQVSRSPHGASTDAEGYWKLLAPRSPGAIEISGTIPGYDLGGETGFQESDPELTREVRPGDEKEISIPEFRVHPIAARTVIVVDSNGLPIRGADVSAKHTATFRDVDGKEFSLNARTLADHVKSDANGMCRLKLTQTSWKDGVVKASRVYIPDDARSDRDVLIQTGVASIKPNSVEPIKVIMREHVLVSGRALVNGKPDPKLRIGLATRSAPAGPFNRYYNGYFQTIDGRFEFKMEPTGEYAIMLCLLADGTNGERHYYHQTPIDSSDSKSRQLGTINIKLDQLQEIPAN